MGKSSFKNNVSGANTQFKPVSLEFNELSMKDEKLIPIHRRSKSKRNKAKKEQTRKESALMKTLLKNDRGLGWLVCRYANDGFVFCIGNSVDVRERTGEINRVFRQSLGFKRRGSLLNGCGD